jgi:hypothetical protein
MMMANSLWSKLPWMGLTFGLVQVTFPWNAPGRFWTGYAAVLDAGSCQQ